MTQYIRPLPRKEIALRISNFLAANHLLQKEVAARTGIVASDLSEVICAKKPMSPTVARALTAIGMDGRYLYLCQALCRYIYGKDDPDEEDETQEFPAPETVEIEVRPSA